ncbi:MAG: DUF2783 domain-containing protein [Alphaproteobacteria bacterium]|jgi:hypothetical protein|nr:DUF2783 domain-containing protein [Alphaproteobacteria bacterium]
MTDATSADTPVALAIEARFERPDDAYALLIDGHRGLTDAESAALNARLVLLLANHVGDEMVLREAIAAARQSLGR